MEFNKVNSSGTLWYLKKWITYYYFIFMKDNLYEKDYDDIIEIFNNYINSLPLQLRDPATDFFFEKDIRDSNVFTSYQDFTQENPTFSSTLEEREYRLRSKKFYFLYLMNIGDKPDIRK